MLYRSCQVTGSFVGCILLLELSWLGGGRGCLPSHSAKVERVGPGAARSGGRRPGHGILYLPIADPQEGSSRRGPHRHLRTDGCLSETAEGTTFGNGGRGTPGRVAKETGRTTDTAAP